MIIISKIKQKIKNAENIGELFTGTVSDFHLQHVGFTDSRGYKRSLLAVRLLHRAYACAVQLNKGNLGGDNSCDCVGNFDGYLVFGPVG